VLGAASSTAAVSGLSGLGKQKSTHSQWLQVSTAKPFQQRRSQAEAQVQSMHREMAWLTGATARVTATTEAASPQRRMDLGMFSSLSER
jgi:hypothetical protein